MKILKTGCGNAQESFIEDRLTDGVNVIFSNDNNKGKTIILQGMMYALGNEPIFPSGLTTSHITFIPVLNTTEIYLSFCGKTTQLL